MQQLLILLKYLADRTKKRDSYPYKPERPQNQDTKQTIEQQNEIEMKKKK